MPASPPWIDREPNGFRVKLRLTPKSSRDQIEGTQRLADGRDVITARVSAIPENGKANKAMIKLLAKASGVAPSAIRVVSGATARLKTVHIAGAPELLIAHVTATANEEEKP